MILGFYKPTGGTIYINGIPVEAYDCKTFYKEICYISQEEMLLNESVEDYLRYAAHADLKADNIEQMRRKVKLRPEIKILRKWSNSFRRRKKETAYAQMAFESVDFICHFR